MRRQSQILLGGYGPPGSLLAFAIAGALLGRRFSALLREMEYAQWLPQAELNARTESAPGLSAETRG